MGAWVGRWENLGGSKACRLGAVGVGRAGQVLRRRGEVGRRARPGGPWGLGPRARGSGTERRPYHRKEILFLCRRRNVRLYTLASDGCECCFNFVEFLDKGVGEFYCKVNRGVPDGDIC